MDYYLLFADEEWDRRILNDTSTFYQGPLQSVKEINITIYLGKLHLQTIIPFRSWPLLKVLQNSAVKAAKSIVWMPDNFSKIYVAASHPQWSRVFCQRTSEHFRADLCLGRKTELVTQQDFLYFLASDFQSSLDNRSHWREIKKTKPPWIDYVDFYSFLKDSPNTYTSLLTWPVSESFIFSTNTEDTSTAQSLPSGPNYFRKGLLTEKSSMTSGIDWELQKSLLLHLKLLALTSSVLTVLTFKETWQHNLFRLLNLCLLDENKVSYPHAALAVPARDT